MMRRKRSGEVGTEGNEGRPAQEVEKRKRRGECRGRVR